MNRFVPAEVERVFGIPQPGGLVDLWNEVPPGFEMASDQLASLRRANQIGIVQGLALLEQKALVAAGSLVGFRPEVFGRLADLPYVDVLATTAGLIASRGLDLGVITQAAKNLTVEILGDIGDAMDASLAVAQYAGALNVIVDVVLGAVNVIASARREEAAARAAAVLAALDCQPPAYSASGDTNLALEATSLLRGSSWQDLFLPLIRPDELGFTCCISAVDHGRVVMPIGVGIGNRIQSAWADGRMNQPDLDVEPWRAPVYGARVGFGCLPMCRELLVHRAIFVPGGGLPPNDPARMLAQLGGVGSYVWHMLWSPGPAAFTLDGLKIADAWAEYFMLLRAQIGSNAPGGFGTHMAPEGRICDSWPARDRQRALAWLFARVGVPDPERAADPDGIYVFGDAAPVHQWRAFADYQAALLERPMISLVDARTCDPAWRSRVAAAQRDLLEHPDAVCNLVDVEAIPDPTYRAAVVARRKAMGLSCWATAGKAITAGGVSATSGPSLDPLGESSPPIPPIPRNPIPRAPTPGRRTPELGDAGPELGPEAPADAPEASEPDGSNFGAWVAGAVGLGAAVGVGTLLLRGGRARRRR